MKYEFLEHTAEVKLKIYGKSLNKVFENVVLAISEYLSRGRRIKCRKSKVINIRGNDEKNLLYNFINELIYLLDAECFVVCKAKVNVKDGNKLEGKIFGDDAKKYDGLDYIKAATYHEMHINQKKDKTWEAQFVVDV